MPSSGVLLQLPCGLFHRCIYGANDARQNIRLVRFYGLLELEPVTFPVVVLPRPPRLRHRNRISATGGVHGSKTDRLLEPSVLVIFREISPDEILIVPEALGLSARAVAYGIAEVCKERPFRVIVSGNAAVKVEKTSSGVEEAQLIVDGGMAGHEAFILPNLIWYVRAVLGVGMAHAGDELFKKARHVVEAVIRPDEVLVSKGVGEGMGRYTDAVEIMEAKGLSEHLLGA